MNCPNCQSTDQHRVIWGLHNVKAIFFNILLYAAQLGVTGWIFRKGRPLQRRCLNCGRDFHGPWLAPPDYNRCAKCGYSLIANISGRCPECGWHLPRRYRAYRRKANRKMAADGGLTHPPK